MKPILILYGFRGTKRDIYHAVAKQFRRFSPLWRIYSYSDRVEVVFTEPLKRRLEDIAAAGADLWEKGLVEDFDIFPYGRLDISKFKQGIAQESKTRREEADLESEEK